MSQLSTKPVLRCSRCGKRMVLADLHTITPDPNSELLWDLFNAVAKDALCEYCKKQRQYLIKEGRANEFWKI